MASPENFDSLRDSTFDSNFKPYTPSHRSTFPHQLDQSQPARQSRAPEQYDSSRPLPVESQFQSMHDNDNFLHQMQHNFSQQPPAQIRQHDLGSDYHRTEPNSFRNRQLEGVYRNQTHQLRTEPVEEPTNNSQVIQAMPAQNEHDLNAKLKQAELEMELERRNQDQEALLGRSLDFKLAHANWRLRKNAFYQIRVIIENWFGVAEDQLAEWFERDTQSFTDAINRIFAQKASRPETYSQNWMRSPKLEYFRKKFETRILRIVKEKNIALLDEGLQTIVAYLYMPDEVARFFGRRTLSKAEVQAETPVDRSVFNKMLVLLMNMQPNKKYDDHLHSIFTFALERDSQLITAHILQKCQDNSVSVQLNSLKILLLLLRTGEYAAHREVLADVARALLPKKAKWPVKCRELVCRNLSLCMSYYHGNKHEFLRHFFPFVFKERQVADRFKWLDTGVKSADKFEGVELIRFKKKHVRAKTGEPPAPGSVDSQGATGERSGEAQTRYEGNRPIV